MQLIDTHNHLYLPEFEPDCDEVVRRSVDAGVIAVLMPNIDSQSVGQMLKIEEKYHGYCLPMMGLHPTSVKGNYRDELQAIEKHLAERKFFGIGETGIDLYWDKTWIDEQIISFRRHLELAENYDLPVVVHARESIEIIFRELESFGSGRVKGIFHAFPGGREEARKAVSLGFMIGVGGVVTFRNSRLAEAVIEAGIENIVLETDAPYLAPVPHRGKRNESAYLTLVTEKIAEILSIQKLEVAGKTTYNARNLFNI